MNPYLQKYKYNGKTYICLYNGIGYDFQEEDPRPDINMNTSLLLMPTFFPNRIISSNGNVLVFFPKERKIETNHSQSKYLQLKQKVKAFLKRKSEKSDSQKSDKSRKEQDSKNSISKITTDLY